jgi:lipoyl(octanoyl) transferase
VTLLVYNFRDFIPFHLAWQWQKDLVKERKLNPGLPDVLLLLEHQSIYTIGQGSSLSFFKKTVEYVKTERGGEVTYHAPGQLVGYVILNLRGYRQDLHWYLRQLEEVLILSLQEIGITGERRSGLTGVWVKDHKIAQIGIKVSRWITMHGFALNVSIDKTGFEPIVPCGIADCKIANIQDFCSIEIEEVKGLIEKNFRLLFP